MKLLRWISRRRFPYEPLISVRISKSRLLHNYEEFRRLAGSKAVAPVLKSNAYGHGLFEVAEILHDALGSSIPFTIVDSYFEAIALRVSGCRHPILVIGYTSAETISRSYLPRVSFMVGSLEVLRGLHGPRFIPRAHRISIHLKIDTGMRRQGILPDEVPEAMKLIGDNESVVLDGACTHLCDADNADESFTEAQINIWNKLAREIKAAFPDIRYLHAANTDGTRYARDIEGNVARLGIGLYGIADSPGLAGSADLRPALEMRTILTGKKRLVAGETVGYGNSYRAEHDMTIATIPVGYYEGLDRRLSSGVGGQAHGYVLVGPRRVACPIIGRVSMNIATIDISDAADAGIGTEVIVMSGERGDKNTVMAIARAIGTIPYEVAVKIPTHLKRVVID